MHLPERYKTKKFWINMALFGALGAIGGLGIGMFGTHFHVARPGLAIFAGAALSVIGLGSVVSGAFGLAQDTHGSTPLWAGLGMLCCGLSYLAPIYGPVWLSPAGALALFSGLTLLSLLITWKMYRNADEMQRNVMNRASVVGYGFSFFAILFYAAAITLGFQIHIRIWDLIGAVVIAQTVLSVTIGSRSFAPLPAD